MKPAVAVARVAQTRLSERPTIAAVCRPILAGAVEPSFVANEIARQGFPVQSIETESADLADIDVLLFLGNAGWRPKIIQQIRGLPAAERPFVAIWHWEPLPPPHASGLPRPGLGIRELGKIVLRDARATDPFTNFATLRGMMADDLIDLLVVSTPSRQEFLAEEGYPAEYIPLGAGPDHGRDLGSIRDIDVLFLGETRTPRRSQTLKQLKRLGLEVSVAGSWEDPRYWGEERTALLNRVKILLNIPRSKGDYSGLRMLLGGANGAMVLSEPLYRPQPFLAGQQYVEAEPSQLPSMARMYLDDEPARLTITRAARRLILGDATRERSVARLLDIISSKVKVGTRS
jgi:hypothetical protein